jgi:cytochrome c oxidase subunit 2
MRAWRRLVPGLLLLLPVAGCNWEQSVLAPGGREAEQISSLFWVMTALLAAVFVGVMALAVLAWTGGAGMRRRLAGERSVWGGGLVFPVVALSALFVSGLLIMASRAAPGSDGALRVAISGEQWWWRVTYQLADGRRVESANEVRIPVGQPVEVELTTADVIHSFWVPNLAGKLDMIPGRTNVLTLLATEPGISRGQCAEYCGGAHALMAFHVVALAPDAFADWFAHERSGQPAAAAESAERGAVLFSTLGCSGCHTIRGTPATGVIGPDLTHVSSRLSLAAGTLPNDAEAFVRWIRNSQHIKPGNRMPPYTVLSDEDLSALARYLDGLE